MNIRKKLDDLIKISKGIALLNNDQKKQLMESLDSASEGDLESLYQILLDEQATMEKLEKNFQEESYAALQEYYATVKEAVKVGKRADLEVKNEKSTQEDLAIADNILGDL